MTTCNYYAHLKSRKGHLTPQQYRTFKSQIRAGDTDGYIRGISKLLSKEKKINARLPATKEQQVHTAI